MNQALPRILVALSMLGIWGVVPPLSAAESGAQQGAQALTQGQTTETAVLTQEETAVSAKPDSEPKPASGTQSAVQADPANAAATEKVDTPEKALEPVTGAFGIPLGERFAPCMVARIISQGEKTYLGPDKKKLKGTLYQVEPKVTNTHFTGYSVATTADGIIYSIGGEYESTEKASKCDVAKKLGAFLEDKYGKPRGKGMLGEWYSFRDMSSSVYRGVRLYAPRCRNGRYSILYSDDNAKTAAAPPAPEPTETSGL